MAESKYYEQGYAACLRKETSEKNPYDYSGTSYNEWFRGYFVALYKENYSEYKRLFEKDL